MYGNQKIVALFGNMHQTNKSKYANQVVNLLRANGYGIIVERGFHSHAAQYLDGIADGDVFDGGGFNADFAISLGGDGTFLRTAMFVGDKGIPILGINIGHLGFMSEVNPENITEAIESIVAGNYKLESRSVLEVAAGSRSLGVYPFALNDIAVLKQDISSMIKIKVSINNEYLTTYSSDGIVVATPTGSTGYSLSAGGPVVVPESKSVIIAPVAPHSLSVRPIVICDNVEIKMNVTSRTGHFLVAVDGRSTSCGESEEITIRRAPYDIKIMHCGNKSFFDTMREKLMWDGDLQK